MRGLASSRKYGRDLAMKSRSPKRSASPDRSASSSSGSPTTTSFVGGRSSQARRSPTAVSGRLWKSAYAGGVRHLRDVELVVDVAVEAEAGVLHGRDRLPRELDGDRLVQEPLAGRRIDDGRTLVADERLPDPRRARVGEGGAEHPPRGDQERGPCCARRADRGDRARAELTVLRDQSAVEVAGERRDVGRKGRRKDQPEVDWTT
jgi:hypothetical protein